LHFKNEKCSILNTSKANLVMQSTSEHKFYGKFTEYKQIILNSSILSLISKVKKLRPIRQEYKPWGFYKVVLIRPGFLIKYLIVNPLSCTSKQIHQYREEHIIVISGVGIISLQSEVNIVKRNHTITIPKHAVHRIENRSGQIPLEIVEIQVGSYLSESDIIRLEDIYCRVHSNK
ncbi:phosphomannose isomerase type II C-terminal cupin domain, partial [Wolbachia endosymbiont of Pentidionis agamae]|uniref:phosphomannose isomerase type II C-terminal cupin domain n=1 Tax=Wolbachia endosymbiont of Pentidionis agamae TaxID=3110435 RepID=UPI002FD3D748